MKSGDRLVLFLNKIRKKDVELKAGCLVYPSLWIVGILKVGSQGRSQKGLGTPLKMLSRALAVVQNF